METEQPTEPPEDIARRYELEGEIGRKIWRAATLIYEQCRHSDLAEAN